MEINQTQALSPEGVAIQCLKRTAFRVTDGWSGEMSLDRKRDNYPIEAFVVINNDIDDVLVAQVDVVVKYYGRMGNVVKS